MYVIQEGSVQVSKDNRFVRTMKSGVFGELAILHQAERTASVRAIQHCYLWAIERKVFCSIMIETARETTASHKRHLKWSKRFGHYCNATLNRLSEVCAETTIDSGRMLKIRPQYVYLITKGEV
ncbi:hypothetical protein WR25_07980 [Diploscapter pachys]|uniref:Cyclic nucleotide-binding domain-containing protein n=1 Tax=Diploscapter pachys TaxID=2018661 RepID=A0A2A2KP90_9BILA|nr:hypothetical protein WR25_07980 [Diploscapter pachys]